MDRIVLIEDSEISLVNYTHDDDLGMFQCWLDKETQIGYNTVFKESFENFQQEDITRFPFFSSILDKKSNKIIGAIRLSPPEYQNDIAIWIFKPYRNKGFGFKAFLLGLRYCFQELNLKTISAGCYGNNTGGRRILEKVGFTRDPSGDINEIDPFHQVPITQFNFIITRDQFYDSFGK